MATEEETVRNSVKMALLDLSVVDQKEFEKIQELKTYIHLFPHFCQSATLICMYLNKYAIFYFYLSISIF